MATRSFMRLLFYRWSGGAEVVIGLLAVRRSVRIILSYRAISSVG